MPRRATSGPGASGEDATSSNASAALAASTLQHRNAENVCPMCIGRGGGGGGERERSSLSRDEADESFWDKQKTETN